MKIKALRMHMNKRRAQENRGSEHMDTRTVHERKHPKIILKKYPTSKYT
jgi:hypothetical protein